MKYYIKYVDKYKIFENLYHVVTSSYKILMKSISNQDDYKGIGNSFLNYINSLKKFEEKSKRELKNTGWKKILQNQFKGDKVVEIKYYIEESFQVLKFVSQEIYKLILLEDHFLIKFCVRLHQFHNRYSKENSEEYKIYISNTNILSVEDNKKIDLSNQIDILFIKELLLAKKVNVTNMEFQIGQRILYDDIEYICVSKSKDISNNKIKEQSFFPSCLSMKDINFILHNKEK